MHERTHTFVGLREFVGRLLVFVLQFMGGGWVRLLVFLLFVTRIVYTHMNCWV